ncbi:hypothetical protein [Robiginitalea sp.]|uniref:hypothetical protein n=1 Tax=Robiginitalea sp. TaxID=1902411 RepID=UPI003C743B66
MKRIFLTMFWLACTLSAYGQQEAKEDLKVKIFTAEERDNLQLWFHEEVKRMGLSEEKESQYSSILIYYIAKISRLDDKDQNLSKAEFKARLNEYLKKQDEDLREILTDEQFAIHKEIYGEFLRSAYRRWGI